jgi:hypothetical protein
MTNSSDCRRTLVESLTSNRHHQQDRSTMWTRGAFRRLNEARCFSRTLHPFCPLPCSSVDKQMRLFHVQHIPGPDFMRSVSPRMIRSEQHPYRLYAYHTHQAASVHRSAMMVGRSQDMPSPVLTHGATLRVTFNSVSLSDLKLNQLAFRVLLLLVDIGVLFQTLDRVARIRTTVKQTRTTSACAEIPSLRRLMRGLTLLILATASAP